MILRHGCAVLAEHTTQQWNKTATSNRNLNFDISPFAILVLAQANAQDDENGLGTTGPGSCCYCSEPNFSLHYCQKCSGRGIETSVIEIGLMIWFQEGLLYFPSSLEDIRSLAGVLGVYRQLHPQYVLLLFSSAYLFKQVHTNLFASCSLAALLQTFAVPGSVFLNVLAGAIFGSYSGFVLCCLLTACGASLCFFLARWHQRYDLIVEDELF